MRAPLKLLICTILFIATVSIAPTHAALYNFSYTWASGEEVSGTLEGVRGTPPFTGIDLHLTTTPTTYTPVSGPQILVPFGRIIGSYTPVFDRLLLYMNNPRGNNDVLSLATSEGDAFITLGADIHVYERFRSEGWNLVVKPVPSPSSMLLLGTGLLGLVGYRWHQRRREGTQVG